VQDVFRTHDRPQGKKTVLQICERSTAAHGDKARVALWSGICILGMVCLAMLQEGSRGNHKAALEIASE